MTSSSITAALGLLGAGLFAHATAATGQPAAVKPPSGIVLGKLADGSAYDQLWSVPVLYQNEANPWLQELALQGQLQVQYAYGSEDDDNFGSGDLSPSCRWGDVEVRRFRLGLRARGLRVLKFHSLLDLYPDLTPRVYKGIAETYVTYAPADAFNLSIGKTELKFTREQEVSSRDYLNFERSQLVNMFYGGELSGAWVSGKNIAGGWLYELGVYANDRRDEWTDFDGGTMVLAKAGYNYSGTYGWDFAQAAVHFLHNTEPGYAASPYDLASPRFANAVAVSNDVIAGRFALATECFWGDGTLGQADVGGFTAIPAYYLTPKLQLVTTFQFACSASDDGICLPYRYESQIDVPKSDKTGDTYLAAYAGLNYYFYGHKLKVMSGAKYSHLSGGENVFDGWTFMTGCRMMF